MDTYKYICEKCNYKCNFKSELEKHYNTGLHKTGKRAKRKDYQGEEICEKCDYKTKNKTTMKQHKLNEHGTIEERQKGFKYYCEKCDFGTFSKDIMEKHNNTKKHIRRLNISVQKSAF